MMNKLLYTLVFCLIAQFALAQDTKYDYAKKLIKDGKYSQAITVLQSVLDNSSGGIYPNALYLQAFSQYKVGQLQAAKQSLFKLTEQYDGWKGKNDAYFLMATIEFDWQNATEAMKTLESISGSGWQTQITNLKKSKLSKLTTEGLSRLYVQYPEDEVVGRVLLAKLYEQDADAVNMELAKELQAKYNADGKPTDKKVKSTKKDTYRIAVLLPFQYKSLSNNQGSFVVDIYEGILIAKEQLEAEGIRVELHTFDTEKDSAAVVKILANKELKKMDLLIGPLYEKPIELVKHFSTQYNIPFVNPISESLRLVDTTPLGFLTASSRETQSGAAADFAIDSLHSRSAYIITTNLPKDTLMAQAYIKQLEKRGGVIKNVVRFNFEKNSYYEMVDDIKGAKREEAVHFFIATKDITAGKTSLSAILNQAIEAPIIAPNSWINNPQMSIARLEQINTYFVAPYFIDERAEKVRNFESIYVDKTGGIPSTYAYLGYETLFVFGNALFTYGTGFYQELKSEEKVIPPALFDMSSYLESQDNISVPILKLEEGKLINLNKDTE